MKKFILIPLIMINRGETYKLHPYLGTRPEYKDQKTREFYEAVFDFNEDAGRTMRLPLRAVIGRHKESFYVHVRTTELYHQATARILKIPLDARSITIPEHDILNKPTNGGNIDRQSSSGCTPAISVPVQSSLNLFKTRYKAHMSMRAKIIESSLADAGKDKYPGKNTERLMDNVKIYISENLFSDEDLHILRAQLQGTDVIIETTENIRANVTNRNLPLNRSVAILTRADIASYWRESHAQQTRAIIIPLDDDLTTERYLYFERLIRFSRALLARDHSRLTHYLRELFADPIDEDTLIVLINQGPLSLMRSAIFRFKPMPSLPYNELQRLKFTMETYLQQA